MSKKNLSKILDQFYKEKKFNELVQFCNNELLQTSNLEEKETILKFRCLGFAGLGERDNFKNTLKDIFKINSKNYFANFNLAQLYYNEMKFEETLPYSKTLFDLKKNAENTKLLSNNLIALKKYEEASKILHEAILLFKQDHYFLFSLGSLYFKWSKYQKSLEYLLKIDKKFYSNEIILLQIGLVYLKIGELIKAEKFFLKILKINNHSIASYTNIIFIKLALGDNVQAGEFLKKALKINSLDATLIYYEYEIFNKISDYKIDTILKNIENYNINDQITIYFVLAKYFEKNKNYEKFKFYLNEANCLKRKTYPKYSINNHLNGQLELQKYQSQEYYNTYKRNKSDAEENNSSNHFSFEPIFIVGMPRSGSTLVEQILSSHSQIEGLGEVSFFTDVLNEEFGDVSFDILVEKLKKNQSKKLFEEIGYKYLRKISLTMRKSNKYVVDKMLFNYQFLSLIKMCIPGAKFIFCTRDKHENFFSIYKHNFQDSFLPWCYSIDEMKKVYDNHLSLLSHFKKILSKELFETKYENIILEFEQEVKKIFGYLNLEVEEACYDFYKTNRSVITASNMQVRKSIYNTSLKSPESYKLLFPDIFK